MILKGVKLLLLGCVVVGFVGCNDGEKTQNTPPQALKETNTTLSNPLDRLTATLPQGIDAQNARKITDEATTKLFQVYFVNGAGKLALENTIQIINARIEKMTKNGVFDGTNLNTFIAKRV